LQIAVDPRALQVLTLCQARVGHSSAARFPRPLSQATEELAVFLVLGISTVQSAVRNKCSYLGEKISNSCK